MVKQTFYKSVNGNLSYNQPHEINGANRELFVVDGPNHLDILYNDVAIREIVKWTTHYVLGAEQTTNFNPFLINLEVYVSLVGGTITIISALWLIHGKVWREKKESEPSRGINVKALLKNGLIATLFAGVFGSLVAIVTSFALSLATPLFFANFITALFFGSSVILALIARTRLKSSNKGFSYFRLVKESIRKPSLKVDVSLGIVGVISFILLLFFMMGSFTSLTFSTSSMRLISLPLYTLIFAIVFMSYESFFKAFARPLMGTGVIRMIFSMIFELVVVFSIFVFELVATASILSLFMPFLRLDFFVLGLNLVFIPLMISIVSAEVFYVKTGGWIAQIIISALVFATLTLVFTPALRFF